MYEIKVKDSVFTCPDTSIVPFALMQAMDRGIMSGPIHDAETAINYLTSIGMEVSLCNQEKK